MKTHELLNSENHCRGNYSIRKEDGRFTSPRVGPNGRCDAYKFDICGALMHCYEDNNVVNNYLKLVDDTARNTIKRVTKSSSGKDVEECYTGWVDFNDSAQFPVIQEFLLKLDI